LITLPTTAHNLDRGRKGESCCALLEVVGLLLSHQLTKPNEISAALPAFANGSQFLHRQSSEFRRKVALEDSANAGVRHFALKPIRPKPACDLTWSKMCLVELTASRGTNEDKRK
jgi:hypothetical protein